MYYLPFIAAEVHVVLLTCRSLMTGVYESLFNRLQDNVPTVREAAAIALGCIVSAHGNYNHCCSPW